jgi:predicted metalloprotease with PDZ domain
MLQGQALVSVADAQWVLQQAGDTERLTAEVVRPGQPFATTIATTMELPQGWRRTGDISWRATTWDLRRMVLGGLLLDIVPEAERIGLVLAQDTMALRVNHVGQYGDHARAKQAGVQAGDIVVSYNGRADLLTESQLISHALQSTRPGDTITLEVRRKGEPQTCTFLAQ